MTVDVSALRRFQEVWEPVVQSIPAVLNMVEKEADLDRALNHKRIELDKAQKEIDAAFDNANVRLNAAKDDLAAMAEKKKAIMQEIADAQAKAKEAATAAEKQKNDTLAQIQDSIIKVKAQLDALQGDYDAKRAKAEAEHSSLIRSMTAEIDDLNARKEAAEKALDAIKAKLS